MPDEGFFIYWKNNNKKNNNEKTTTTKNTQSPVSVKYFGIKSIQFLQPSFYSFINLSI